MDYLKTCKSFNTYFCDDEKTNRIYTKRKVPRKLHSYFPNASKELIDLLEKIFQYDPHKRISVEEICNHPYFQNVNFSCLKAKLDQLHK